MRTSKGKTHIDPLPGGATVVYRPYVSGSFFDPLTGIPVDGAPYMLFTQAGKVYCPQAPAPFNF